MIDLANIPGIYARVSNGEVEIATAKDTDPAIVAAIITAIISAVAAPRADVPTTATAAPPRAPVAEQAKATPAKQPENGARADSAAGKEAHSGPTASRPTSALPPADTATAPCPTSLYPMTCPGEQALWRSDAWLSDVIESYRGLKTSNGDWRKNSWEREFEPTLRYFREIVSDCKRTVEIGGEVQEIYDIRIGDITPALIGRYIDAMRHWPKNFAQGVRGAKKKLTAKDALAKTDGPVQAFATATKKFDCVGALLRWSDEQFYLPYGLRFARMLPSKDKSSAEESRYMPYTKRELAILFQSEDYQTVSFATPALYWTPLIGEYTGLRLNEMCQLFVSDIKRHESGILYFDVTTVWDDSDYDPAKGPKPENHKRLKSRASRRKVPIPQVLLDIGFLTYLEFIKSLGCNRLFPDLKFEEKSGYGRVPSAKWREYTKKCNVYEEKKVQHSFRITLNQVLTKLTMAPEFRDRSMGHAVETINCLHYGGELPLDYLKQTLDRVDFGVNHPKFFIPDHWHKMKIYD